MAKRKLSLPAGATRLKPGDVKQRGDMWFNELTGKFLPVEGGIGLKLDTKDVLHIRPPPEEDVAERPQAEVQKLPAT